MREKSEQAIELSRLERLQEEACVKLREIANRLANISFDESRTDPMSGSSRVAAWRQNIDAALTVMGWESNEIPREVLTKTVASLRDSGDLKLARQLQFNKGRCRLCHVISLDDHTCWDENLLPKYMEETNLIEGLAKDLAGAVDPTSLNEVLNALAKRPRSLWDATVFEAWRRSRSD